MDGDAVLKIIKKIRNCGSIFADPYLTAAIFAEQGIAAEVRALRLFDDELCYGEKPIVLETYDRKTIVGGVKLACDGADELIEQIQIFENDFFQRFVYNLCHKIRKRIYEEKTFCSIPAEIGYHLHIPMAILILNVRTNFLECVAGDERFRELKVHREDENIITDCFNTGAQKMADRIGLNIQDEVTLEPLSPFLVIPIKNGEIIGVAVASVKDRLRWEVAALTALLGEIGTHIENFVIVERLRNEAQFDGFLQILDRTAFEQRLKDVLSKRLRGRGAALLMIDLDNFKTFNDSRGHIEGDALLKKIVSEIEKCKRSGDLLGRYGGDEFALFLQDIEPRGVRKVCERIISKCSRIESGVSCSIGAHCWSGEGKGVEELFKVADADLYKAKIRKGTYVISEEHSMMSKREVYDERIFAEFLKKCEEERKRYGIPFVVLKCEGDGDGDGKILNIVRASDIVGRYEGKIGVILTNTIKKNSGIVIKRLKEAGVKVSVI